MSRTASMFTTLASTCKGKWVTAAEAAAAAGVHPTFADNALRSNDGKRCTRRLSKSGSVQYRVIAPSRWPSNLR